MRVMRDNKESLMAVLEAFVYDPLFAWKLVATAPTDQPVATEGQTKLIHIFETIRIMS